MRWEMFSANVLSVCVSLNYSQTPPATWGGIQLEATALSSPRLLSDGYSPSISHQPSSNQTEKEIAIIIDLELIHGEVSILPLLGKF